MNSIDIRSTTDQQRKSRRGLEKSTRRLERRGITLPQLEVRAGTTAFLGSIPVLVPTVEEVDFAPLSKQPEPHTIASDGFRIEYQCKITNSWIGTPSDETTYSKQANLLLDRAGTLAKSHLGTRFRIIRTTQGARAVHRIAARVAKAGGIELYKWST